MHRRRFLELSLAATGASVLPFPSLSSEPPGAPVDGSVLIIGAGMAGLAAARKLAGAGVPVSVLEARDRIGGRIWTDSSLGFPIDLGASWIHRTKGNPVTRLAEEFGARTVPSDYEAIELHDLDGRRLAAAEVAEMWRHYRSMMRELRQMRKDVEPSASLARAFEQLLPKLPPPEMRGLRWAIASEIEVEYAADLSELSWRSWDEDEEFEGPDVYFPGGYRQIVAGMAHGLPITLGCAVKKIEHLPGGVRVLTNQGTFTAGRVVVTLPLGVLKSGAVEFHPALPAEKRQAIQRLGMGTMNKIVLTFPRRFWPEESQLLGVLSDDPRAGLEFFNLSAGLGRPVLVALSGGSLARAIDRMSRHQAVELALADLRRMYGRDIPTPTGAMVTGWGADPFAGGSYSHLAPGAAGADYEALAEPVGDRLFFAGEATNRSYPQTVHGALLSGEREAKRILRLQAHKNG